MSLVTEYMTPKMITGRSEETVLEICRAMANWKVSSIAVTDQPDRRIIGVITERDIVMGIANGMQPDKILAASLMSSPVLLIGSDQSVEDAAQMMLRNRVRHLLVRHPDKGIMEIITTTDLARYLKKRAQNSSIGEDQSSNLGSEVWELYF